MKSSSWSPVPLVREGKRAAGGKREKGLSALGKRGKEKEYTSTRRSVRGRRCGKEEERWLEPSFLGERRYASTQLLLKLEFGRRWERPP